MSFDKDIELLKITLVSEEIRTRFYTALGALLSLMIGIAFAELGFGTQIGIVITVALLFVLLAIIGSTFYELKRYREQFSQLEALIKNVENGKTNGDLNEILKSFR